ncbi:prepilin-type N-terminal cleavage/methylation domain-containing protein [Niveibacterium sp. 24ML]|uniref:type IV pilus modification PilV family protein n=1 Tax=Niveibacterium sp. 24ML TaxID=2985512 RepID=UPI002271AFD0|nr:prepilin-type N-terminal cleavage/methylation domain-containing protein [Niveibacterium sp. 24ML]MCX9155076.1 prepilin-type N-terminal cleavage/methylation domain-containing protein [Niveibacterium sp. 24ML]
MCARPRRQCGVTLVELLAFIVIIGVALAGVLLAVRTAVGSSADPLIQKQMLAIAESLLEEIESKAFTFCDPSDPNALTASSPAGCSPGLAVGLGPLPGQSRYSSTNPFNNVGHYHGFAMNTGILNPADGTPLPGLSAYTASVTISQVGTSFGIAATEALQIDVTVSGPNPTQIPPITLTGYRLRHAPNAVP